MSEQLKELSRPFPDRFVHKNPSGGGSYIKHHVIEQRMIEVLGTPPNFMLVEIVRGFVPAIQPNPQGSSKRAKEGRPELQAAIVGVVARMQVSIEDEPVIVDEAGDCEQPHNWDTDGQRLKDAMSDAYKRCAMRLGVGLHLWSQDEFFLFDKLDQDSRTPQASPRERKSGTSEGVPDASADGSPQEEPVASDPGSSSSPWWGAEYVDKYGAAPFCKAASKFSKNKTKITDPRATEAATEDQRKAIIEELTKSEGAAPVKAGT